MDLSLIPIDKLLEEVESRCDEFIAAFNPSDFQKNGINKFFYGKGEYSKCCGLSNMLNNEVLNNWNGELLTLQELNNEDDKE